MGFFVNIINKILFFSYGAMDSIFQAFGLTWIGVVVGLAVISTILRLFATNLVGTSLNIRHARAEAKAAQRIEAQRARSAKQSASSSARSGRRGFRGVQRSEVDLSRSNGARDHFMNRIGRS